MADPVKSGARNAERTAAERSADHAAIDRLSAELLPALIAKLGATGLGELEVREGACRVRLRRPGDGAAMTGSASRDRRAGERERAARSIGSHQPGGMTPAGPGRDGRDGSGARDGLTGRSAHDGAGHDGAAHDGGTRDRTTQDGSTREDRRVVATSPAVGVFQPRQEARAGTRVRAGDRLGSVDMLGIPQEVVAPSDGVVGASLVEPGDAVEYGQELVLIEFASTSPPEA
jgi:biotin carboxyl carrier protein